MAYGNLPQSSPRTIDASGQIKVANAANCVTGAGTPQLGANSPATVLTAPYKWIKMVTDDGTTVYIPSWK